MRNTVQSIRQKYVVNQQTGCWIWQAASLPRGYGITTWQGKQVYAHRLMYELLVGPIPEGICVLHHCDVPACGNPEHLFLGTIADNSQDALKKGRLRMLLTSELVSGVRNVKAKLTPSQVAEIRSLLTSGRRPKELAKDFGVTANLIRMIARGEIWRSA